jgi:hypothetical protein
MEMTFLLQQIGVWEVVWEQAITRRSKLRGQGQRGLSLCMGCNQTSFSTKKIISWRQFVETYGLCNKGLSPKCLKLSKDFEETKVEKVFGLCITKNGYWYTWCGDEESLWK